MSGTTALHTCFGYAHVVHDRPAGYPFLAELASCAAGIIAIEAAQPRLDLSALEPLADKTVVVGVLDLSTDVAETPEGQTWRCNPVNGPRNCRTGALER